MKSKPLTKSELTKLNEAVETLRRFCESQSSCKKCPFERDFPKIYEYCKFGSFHPRLWDGLEINKV